MIKGHPEWTKTNELPFLSMGETHVWRIPLVVPEIAFFHSLLQQEEIIRANNYVFERDSTRFTVCRARLRQLLAAYVGASPSLLQFGTSVHGKPFLKGESGIEFNVSHAGEFALIAVSKSPVGVDLEEMRWERDWLSLASFFSEEEARIVRESSEDGNWEVLFRLWTCKEAIVKALGVGLSRGLDWFTVDLMSGSDDIFVSLQEGLYQILEFRPAPGMCGALAQKSPAGRVHLLDLWDDLLRI